MPCHEESEKLGPSLLPLWIAEMPVVRGIWIYLPVIVSDIGMLCGNVRSVSYYQPFLTYHFDITIHIHTQDRNKMSMFTF